MESHTAVSCYHSFVASQKKIYVDHKITNNLNLMPANALSIRSLFYV